MNAISTLSAFFVTLLTVSVGISHADCLSVAGGHAVRCDRPAPMGVSISTDALPQPFIFAGSAGMLVNFWGLPQFPLILSNAHVVDATGDLCPNTGTNIFTRIVQPGTLDGGDLPDDRVGFLAKSVPIDFSAGASNLVDAAVVWTSAQRSRSEILGIGQPTRAWGIPLSGQSVTKAGRTSDVTTGTILSVGTTVMVNYGETCGTARFVNQVITDGNLGAPGNSGSVLLLDGDQTGQQDLTPVGLYFAGSDVLGIANPIGAVYQSLRVFVAGETPAPTLAPQQRRGRRLNTEAMETAKSVMSRHENRLMSSPDVVGVGIGEGSAGGGAAIIIYLKRGTASARGALPRSLDGVEVRIIESGEFVAH